MTNIFVTCGVASVTSGRVVRYNDPVNLQLCVSFRRGSYTLREVPGGTLPCIYFNFGAEPKRHDYAWCYDDEAQRDLDLQRLVHVHCLELSRVDPRAVVASEPVQLHDTLRWPATFTDKTEPWPEG